MKTTIAVLNKRGENTAPAIIDVLETAVTGNVSCFGLITPSKQITEKDAAKLRRQNINSPVAAGYISSSSPAQSQLQFSTLEKAMLILEGNIYTPTAKSTTAEMIQPKSDHTKMIQAFLRETEGDYALTIVEVGKLMTARDPIGVQPLYYGENQNLAAVASNRKALWALGIKEARSFPPGHLATTYAEGFKFEPVKTLSFAEPIVLGMDKAAHKLQQLLECSVQMRVLGLKEVAVAFSGGLDSSIVAYLAKKYCPNVQLIHVSMENQVETEEAWEAAEALDLPLQVHLFKEKDVEETIPQVLELIEESEPLKVNVGVPFYWTAEKAAEAKLQVLLAGQGADELFGGYQRYVKEYLQGGDQKVRQTMFSDVTGIYESNLERDEKICIFHNVQLRLPFSSYGVVEFAMSLPTELKFEGKSDSLRKLVLRKVAADLGIPEVIAQRPKKAVQYSTGISEVVKKLAKRQKTTQGQYLEELFRRQKGTGFKLH